MPWLPAGLALIVTGRHCMSAGSRFEADLGLQDDALALGVAALALGAAASATLAASTTVAASRPGPRQSAVLERLPLCLVRRPWSWGPGLDVLGLAASGHCARPGTPLAGQMLAQPGSRVWGACCSGSPPWALVAGGARVSANRGDIPLSRALLCCGSRERGHW